MTLENYVAELGRRMRAARMLRGMALLLAAVLGLTAACAWYLLAVVPGSALVLALRLLLYLLLGAGVILLMARWRRDQRKVVVDLEARVPAFAGRLQTLADARARGGRSALLPLLGSECERIAGQHPAASVVTRWEWLVPSLGAGAALMALALLLSPVAGFWGSASQRLWFGDLFATGEPRIVVAPGNAVVPRGFDVVIEAEAEAFPAAEMTLSARFESGGDWQEARMSRLSDDRYGFVFVAVGEEIDYYVRSRGVASERFSIRVADLPRITSLRLSYEFPAWTGLEREDREDGDVAALPGTRIDVAAQTDKPVAEAFLVINDEPLAMTASSEALTRAFEVAEAGTWHLAVPHEGELARISDRFLITVTPDSAPEVAYVWPGRDRQATAIEEVAMEFSASDDYGVTGLTLNFAVNGGAWQGAALDPEAAAHLLRLEDLRTDAERALAAGDVIALYLEATDHSQTTRSDLYFVDVRPFDRRYRESQQSGGSEGSGGDDLDIAQRQKEILTATWNLINKNTDEDAERGDIEREASVVAMLQVKLREQVEVLVERASARMLDQDDNVADFVASLEKAAAEMVPAASLLEALALDEAVAPEQRALAHLRAAEASVRDINVSLADNRRGRGNAQDSLSELVDLEMDRERNRYETPQAPEFGASQRQDQESEWRRLEELAAREEQRARQRQGAEDLASRWQLSQLQRELEALREELEQRRQSQQRAGQPSSEQLSEAISSLEQAQQALEREPQSGQRTPRTGQALRQAAQALRSQQSADREQLVADARRRAETLRDQQERVMERLEAAQQRSLDDDQGDDVNPWQDFSMSADALTKRRMREELNELRKAIADAVQMVQDDEATAELLQEALTDVVDERLDERLAAAAEAFEVGRPLFVLGHEEIVRRGLSQLAERLARAESQLAAGRRAGEAGDPLRAVDTLRQALSAARDGGGYDRGALESAASQIEALRFRLGESLDLDLAEDRARYQKLGLNSDDPEALYRLARESLDLLEVALRYEDGAEIRAERSRSAARDTSAAAEYYRRLGQVPE